MGRLKSRGEALAERLLKPAGHAPHDFQRAAWEAAERGASALISVPTGGGKTFAAFFGLLAKALETPAKGLRILYISPLRAVAKDVTRAIEEALASLGLDWSVGLKTADASASEKARQRRALPEILSTTPESLHLLLARADARDLFAGLVGVIVDEWHELLQSKRGTQTELALARLRALAPQLVTFGLSATIGNVEEAAQALVGPHRSAEVIRSAMTRPLKIHVLLPETMESFPWAGHLGLAMVGPLERHLAQFGSTIVFTNTRAQAELWFEALTAENPARLPRTAIHHSAIDRSERERIELGLKNGAIDLVVATSSLDLGVDFSPVDHVVQVGSPKGVARLLQRAGRSAHRPGATAELTLVPTHALELLEFRAAEDAIAAAAYESRSPLDGPLDVLAQYAVTRALGGGFTEDELLCEAQDTLGYQSLTRDALAEVLDHLERGGKTLRAYPAHHRLKFVEGRYLAQDDRVARLHRMNIGTIVSDVEVPVIARNGAPLGRVEERFAMRLAIGETFQLAGKVLKLVARRDLKLVVEKGTGTAAETPRWMGGRMPLSTCLASFLRARLDRAAQGQDAGLEAIAGLLAEQRFGSAIPREDELLAETLETEEGPVLFLYPFEGRLVHEGLAAIFAHRMTQRARLTLSATVNDYGLALAIAGGGPWPAPLDTQLFAEEGLELDLSAGAESSALELKAFREVARVAGLILTNHPGGPKSGREVQTSAKLLYEVFRRYDADHLLMRQARREVLTRELEVERLRGALQRILKSRLVLRPLERPSPLSFGLLVDRQRMRVSSEPLLARIEGLKLQWQISDAPSLSAGPTSNSSRKKRSSGRKRGP